MPDTQRPAGETAKPTKDKTKRGVGGFLSKPWWAGIGAVAAVTALGGAVAAVIAILPSGQQAGKSAPVNSVQFSNLSEITVDRYGLTFSYPSDWDLQDVPNDLDGNEFTNPDDSAVSITGYGSLVNSPAHPTISDVEKEWKEFIASLKDSRTIESADSGTFVEDTHGDYYPVDGWRVIYEYVNNQGRSMTDMVKAAYANGREVDLVMEAPTIEFPRYKEAFLQLGDKMLLHSQCENCSAQ